MIFGIERDNSNDEIAIRPSSTEILAAVRVHFPAANPYSSWDALVGMRNPASDWTKPDVLWRRHTDQNFLDAVAEQMLTIAKATESIIDQLTKKK